MDLFNDQYAKEASFEVLSRYQVVSVVNSYVFQGEQLSTAVHRTAAMPHYLCNGEILHVSVRTTYRWCAAFEADGIQGLEPKKRENDTVSTVLSDKVLNFLKKEKERDQEASVPELIKRAKEYGIVDTTTHIDRTTVYRALKRMGCSMVRRKKQRARDMRRFAYPHRMDMVLCDGKHFRAGATRAKRVALFFLDDSTRFGLHVVVGTSEDTILFMRGLYETIRKVGFMDLLYLDRGPGFIAADTFQVAQRLGALLIHGEAAYPEGHGKIERFHRTVKADLLRHLDRRPDVDPACGALELRLQHYLSEVYNHNPHESLANLPPTMRFYEDEKKLRFPQDDQALRRLFVVYLKKRVKNDNIVSVDSVPYEMPTGHAGHLVTLHRNVLFGTVSFFQNGRFIKLEPVDLAANARSRRAKNSKTPTEVMHPLPKSAADLRFERDLGPVVGPDGGFIDNNP
jgi:transposase InsO family protein